MIRRKAHGCNHSGHMLALYRVLPRSPSVKATAREAGATQQEEFILEIRRGASVGCPQARENHG